MKLAIIAALFLTACATGEMMRNVQEGMLKDEVVAILGKPDGFQRNGDYQALTYANRLMSGNSWDRADYSVILLDNKVIEYGPGTVRQSQANTGMLVLVPLR